jgi:hypothetical protein
VLVWADRVTRPEHFFRSTTCQFRKVFAHHPLQLGQALEVPPIQSTSQVTAPRTAITSETEPNTNPTTAQTVQVTCPVWASHFESEDPPSDRGPIIRIKRAIAITDTKAVMIATTGSLVERPVFTMGLLGMVLHTE